ncbi:MAG: hypothetical protein HKM94_08765 [Halobacteria archaeon]|nr:hypothetical protein [Halobacteria archaeon]
MKPEEREVLIEGARSVVLSRLSNLAYTVEYAGEIDVAEGMMDEILAVAKDRIEYIQGRIIEFELAMSVYESLKQERL